MILPPFCQIPNIEEIFSKYFKGVGTFVEVGAFDGKTYGVTWGLALEGWKGIYIEPIPEFAEQCKLNHKYHPDIKTLNCACGDHEGEIDITIFGACSTSVLSRWNKDWGMDETTPKITVPLRTLNSILEEHNVNPDLVVIDVEEAEIQVLKGFDVNKYKPKMLIIELHETQGTEPDQKGWQTPWVDNYLEGYKKIYKDQINTIYVLSKR